MRGYVSEREGTMWNCTCSMPYIFRTFYVPVRRCVAVRAIYATRLFFADSPLQQPQACLSGCLCSYPLLPYPPSGGDGQRHGHPQGAEHPIPCGAWIRGGFRGRGPSWVCVAVCNA